MAEKWSPSDSISSEVLKALGRLTVNFNSLELAIHQVVGALVGKDIQLGQILTASLNLPPLLDRLGALCRYRMATASPEVLADLDATLKRIRAVADRRNEMIHSNWFGGAEAALRIRVTARSDKGWKRQRVDVRPQEIEQLVSDIDSAREGLAAFCSRLPTEYNPQAAADY